MLYIVNTVLKKPNFSLVKLLKNCKNENFEVCLSKIDTRDFPELKLWNIAKK